MDLSDGIAGLALAVSFITLAVSLGTIVLRGRRAELIVTWEVRHGPPRSKLMNLPDVSELFIVENVGHAPARDLRLDFRTADGADARRSALGSDFNPTFAVLAPGHRVGVDASQKTFSDARSPRAEVIVVTWRDGRRGLQSMTTSASPVRVI